MAVGKKDDLESEDRSPFDHLERSENKKLKKWLLPHPFTQKISQFLCLNISIN